MRWLLVGTGGLLEKAPVCRRLDAGFCGCLATFRLEPEPKSAKSSADPLHLLAEVMADPFRGRLLQAVAEKSHEGVSIRQLAARLTEPKRRVRYHLDALNRLGLVQVLRVKNRRGVIERFYRVNIKPLISEEPGDRDQARRILTEALKAILTDATQAVGAGLFGLRRGHTVIRLAIEVDPEGWSELAKIQVQALAEAEAAAARSRERLQASEGPRISAVAAMLLFEASLWPPA